jgi:hypothetical protein
LTSGTRTVGAFAVVMVALALSAPASAALIYVFEPTQAAPGDTVTVRVLPDGADHPRMTLFLVHNDQADSVHSRGDSRLHRLGVLDRGDSSLTFVVPETRAGAYTIADDCPECAKFSAGRRFTSYTKSERTVTKELLPRMVLQIRSDNEERSAVLIGAVVIGGLIVAAVAVLAASRLKR